VPRGIPFPPDLGSLPWLCRRIPHGLWLIHWPMRCSQCFLRHTVVILSPRSPGNRHRGDMSRGIVIFTSAHKSHPDCFKSGGTGVRLTVLSFGSGPLAYWWLTDHRGSAMMPPIARRSDCATPPHELAPSAQRRSTRRSTPAPGLRARAGRPAPRADERGRSGQERNKPPAESDRGDGPTPSTCP
jgi:hypothetical protein